MSGNHNKLKRMVGSLIIIGFLFVSIVFSNITTNHVVDGKTVWRNTTDSDFKNGTLDNLTIQRNGTIAYLKLNKPSISADWTKENPLRSPERRVDHAISSIYGTDKAMMFGGYQRIQEPDESTAYDIVLALDTSGSMSQEMDDLKTAAKNFIDRSELGDNDRLAIYSYKNESAIRNLDFTICSQVGKSSIKNSIDSLSAGGYTPLWDTIGESVNYSIYNGSSSKIPIVIAMTDGEDYGNEGREDGSETYCPWHNYTWGTGEIRYNDTDSIDGHDHYGKYGSWQWCNLADENRYGLLNCKMMKIYTVGLGLEHDDHSNSSSSRFPKGWMGEYAYNSLGSSYSADYYNESGTSEFNLWRVANTSGGEYFYTSNSNQLGGIFQNIADIVFNISNSNYGDSDIIFFEGFESGDWSCGPWLASGNGWGVQSTYQYEGIYYAEGRGAHNNYNLTLIKDLDLTKHVDVKLTMYQYTLWTEFSDIFSIDVSTNSGGSWTTIKSWTGSELEGTTYRKNAISLSKSDEMDKLRIRFRFNMSHNNEYWLIDNVMISGTYLSPNPVSQLSNETWLYDSSSKSWTKQFPTTNPPSRRFSDMADIWGTDKVLLFGGLDSNSQLLSDTWIYDQSDNSWIKKSPLTNPYARRHHVIANIYGTDKAVLFGGHGASSYTDTWLYDLSDNKWSKLAPSNYPSQSFDPAMASIDNDDKTILFDGETNETWVFDLSANNWVKKNPKGKIPTENGEIALATIYGTDKVLMYSGGYHNVKSGETWIYDTSANNWTKQLTLGYPKERDGHDMAGIFGNSSVLLFGGHDNDTWLFNLKIKIKTGTFFSAPYDTGSTSNFKQLSWNVIQSQNASIRFQMRTATSKLKLINEQFIGPNGSTQSFYNSSPSTIWPNHDIDRWIQLKVLLDSTNPDELPTLQDISLIYNNLPMATLITPSNGIRISNNTPSFSWKFSDVDSDVQKGYQVLIDDDLNFSSIDYNSGIQTSNSLFWNFSHKYGNRTLPDGVWYWKVRVLDFDSDWSGYCNPWKVIIDTSPPSSIITLPESENYFNSLESVFGEAFGNLNGSKVTNVELSLERLTDNLFWNGTNWIIHESWLQAFGTNSWYFDVSTVEWTTDTYYNLRTKASDNYTNTEIPGNGITFMYDNKPPEGEISINNYKMYTNSSKVILNLKAVDPGSNVSLVAYGEEGQKWSTWESFADSRNFELTSADGNISVFYKIRDRANNSIEISDWIILDTTPPHLLSISIKNGSEMTKSENVTLNLIAYDNTSGIDQMAFSLDGEKWSSWVNFSFEQNFQLSKGDGEKRIYFKVKDKAGNIAQPVYTTIILNTSILDTDDPGKDSNEKTPSFQFSALLIFVIVLIILLSLAILSIIIRNNKQKKQNEVTSEAEKIYNNLKHEALTEKYSLDSSKLDEDVINDLEKLHKKGEISNATYQNIKNIINDENLK